MIRFATIKRTIKSYLVQVLGIGGTTENRFISPKGLFSKPINEKAIVFNLSDGTNQDVVMALQKDINLEDGDVYLTDDKSFIHYHYATKDISIKTNKLKVITEETTFDTKKFTINTDEYILNSTNSTITSNNTSYVGGSITHNEKPIDDTHTHLQNDGNDAGGGVDTSPPNA